MSEYILKTKRLIWVDIAKAIVIILMIIGHVVPYRSMTYVMIFSFHMPFFFLISGFTSYQVLDKPHLRLYISKLFKSIFLPTIFVTFIYELESLNKFSASSIIGSIERTFILLFWGGTPPKRLNIGIELIWFLIVFFLAKLLLEYLGLIFNDLDLLVLLAVFAFIVNTLISPHTRLPFALDLVPTATLYMVLGRILGRYYKIRSNGIETIYFTKEALLFIISFLIWTGLVKNGLFQDMSTRFFPNWTLNVVEALTGSITILFISISLSKINVIQYFSIIGRHTLMIMFVHLLDQYGKWSLTYNAYYCAIIRTVVDIVIALILVFILKSIKRRAKRWIIE